MLWIRVAWRLLEWPVSIGVCCVVPGWLAWRSIPPVMVNNKPDYFPPLMATATVVGAGLIVLNALHQQEQTTLIGYLSKRARGIVAEERKRMEMERGQDSNDTYLRPVE